jgi:penicillin-binding protein 1A
MARQLIFAQYGNEAYTRGLNVYPPSMRQNRMPLTWLRQGIMTYERRQHYRGPEKFVNLPPMLPILKKNIDDLLADHPDNGDVLSAMVLEANAKKIVAMRPNGDTLEITAMGSSQCNLDSATRRHPISGSVAAPSFGWFRLPKQNLGGHPTPRE